MRIAIAFGLAFWAWTGVLIRSLFHWSPRTSSATVGRAPGVACPSRSRRLNLASTLRGATPWSAGRRSRSFG